MTTVQEAAEALNGCQYREEGSRKLWSDMKAAGLVAVFGASDDLMEFRGAIDAEVGAYDGTTAYVTRGGLFTNACECENCPYAAQAAKAATPIDAKWNSGGYSWQYDTAIPHAKFTVFEDEDTYCEGIVFALADVPLSSEPSS